MKFFLLLCLSAMVIMMCQAKESLHHLNIRRANNNLKQLEQLELTRRQSIPGQGYAGLGARVGGGVSAELSAGFDAGIGAGAYGYGYGGLGGGIGNPYNYYG